MLQKCDVSVVLEAFLDHSLDEVLTWLSTEAPEVTAVEVGAGGYAPHPHLEPDTLLTDASARQAWLGKLAGHGIKLDALNVWGNPLHPDKAIADDHDAALRRAVRLAGELGTNTIVAMSGAPAAAAGDHAAVFGAGGWLPYLEGVHDRQWEESVVPYWTELSAFAANGKPRCQDLHRAAPGYDRLQRGDLRKVHHPRREPVRQPGSEPFLLDADGRRPNRRADHAAHRPRSRQGCDVQRRRSWPQRSARPPLAGQPGEDAVELLGSRATARTPRGGTSSLPASTAPRFRRSPSSTRTRSSIRRPG